MLTYKDIITPIGTIRISASLAGLTSVILLSRKADKLSREKTSIGFIEEAETQLQGYFSGAIKRFDLPLDWSGMPPFRLNALRKTAQIPWGEVISYGELARHSGNPKAARAAGGALAHNPFLLVVPCHRVIASDGSLHGFMAEDGLKIKQQLLEIEGHKIVNGKVIFTK